MTNNIEQDVRKLKDRVEIEDMIYRYCRAVDRMDGALLKSVFHEDSVDDHGRFKGSGHAFADMTMSILPKMHFTAHHVTNVLIELEGDIAHVESYFIATQIAGDPQRHETVYGRYVDRFERRNAEWKIAKRLLVLDWTRVDPAGERSPHEHKFTRGRRDRSDAVYHR
jgi:SnoaL-like domain